ncbi:hypothetical protein SAMN02745244_02719 [Tessaracoccus bendigoensis DSM 12906]|uniref:Uncharacterized protein n=1 Tax=Tessaracoccus bendigoensis DSM 12906 TaxID=1123357 RepID=A0A1M6K398_9ACTN|nr:hypothetical protein [Tessaracoccus bendigoensis]SHJ53322.1 hypothetical protein SAMN02745244_02719 [Tessaracoccus bendigoensis DSM 12906]
MDWLVLLIAAATLAWTVLAFFLNLGYLKKALAEQLNQTASITSREQFTTKLQHAIGLCLAGSNEAKRMGLILLYDLMIDSAARASDRELARKLVNDVNRQFDEGGERV